MTPESLLTEALRADCEYQWAKAGHTSEFVTALHATTGGQWSCRSNHPMQTEAILAHEPLRAALERGLALTPERLAAALYVEHMQDCEHDDHEPAFKAELERLFAKQAVGILAILAALERGLECTDAAHLALTCHHGVPVTDVEPTPWTFEDDEPPALTPERLRERFEKVLADHAIVPNQDGFHGWRCGHPDRYPDYCHCVPDLLTDLLAAIDSTK